MPGQARTYSPLNEVPATLPEKAKRYGELSEAEVDDFWKSRWDVHTASNMYAYVTELVSIEDNLADDNVGRLMFTTFRCACDWAWKLVISRRRGNEQRSKVMRFSWFPKTHLALETNVFYRSVRKIDEKYLGHSRRFGEHSEHQGRYHGPSDKSGQT